MLTHHRRENQDTLISTLQWLLCLAKEKENIIPAPWKKQFIREQFQKKPGIEREKYCKKRSKADLILRHLQD